MEKKKQQQMSTKIDAIQQKDIRRKKTLDWKN